jgi:Ulp1 family protease
MNARKFGNLVRSWLAAEARVKLKVDSFAALDRADGSHWQCVVNTDVTLQENAHACGVHVCMNADLIASNIPLLGAFKTEDTNFFRIKIATDIFRGRLAYDL